MLVPGRPSIGALPRSHPANAVSVACCYTYVKNYLRPTDTPSAGHAPVDAEPATRPPMTMQLSCQLHAVTLCNYRANYQPPAACNYRANVLIGDSYCVIGASYHHVVTAMGLQGVGGGGSAAKSPGRSLRRGTPYSLSHGSWNLLPEKLQKFAGYI